MLRKRLAHFVNMFGDGRYEDLLRGRPAVNAMRDVAAGLVVAMVAIPLAMGFAIASGLRPEQGIVGGAVAGLVGALFGGSKYQVYGPTAAFIPVIAGVMAAHDHSFLVTASILAGVILALTGIGGLGRYVAAVPHSIIVGFTIGIATTIALSQSGEVFGFSQALPYKTLPKLQGIVEQFGSLNIWAVAVAVGTLVLTKGMLKISVYIPGPLVSLGLFTWLSETLLADTGLTVVREKYGEIAAAQLVLTPPGAWEWSAPFVGDMAYAVAAIVFVAAVESLLCSRMADRLANNKGIPFDPDKELWGQGLVNIFVPIFNGFPHTGALARTAINIRLGAISPLAGILKFVFKLALAFYLATYLEMVPMACIGGILLYVATNMVKGQEITEVLAHGRFHIGLMVFTALAVIVTDFLTGVLSALAIFWLQQRFFAQSQAKARPAKSTDDRVSIAGELALARRPRHAVEGPESSHKWLRNIRQRGHVAPTAYVHPKANVVGRVLLSDHVHVAAGTSVRADEGTPFFFGANTNVQDGVIIHALKDRTVQVAGEDWAVYVGSNVSIAHGAIVHGPCYLGDNTFVGFQATVHDSVVGADCFIGIGAVVVGVEIPDGKHVPNGAIVDSAAKVAGLADSTEHHADFNEDVVDVNRGLAAAYRRLRGRPPHAVHFDRSLPHHHYLGENLAEPRHAGAHAAVHAHVHGSGRPYRPDHSATTDRF
ncbi:MAG: hypothetical protein EXR77_18620 [Myxococcales bacterium]|nr:hypothetical protein [Myxococcales bacterium]